MCVYVCVYIYIYIYIYTYIWIRIYICKYVCVCVHSSNVSTLFFVRNISISSFSVMSNSSK